MTSRDWSVPEDFLFGQGARVRDTALDLYRVVEGLGLVCPHGHVSPNLLADPDARFANPTELLVKYDHYLFRLLYSQGVPPGALGVGQAPGSYDPLKAWEVFCAHFHLFDGTPSGLWLRIELTRLFGVKEKPNAGNARKVYDQIQGCLDTPEFTPRALFRRFGIEILATTDAAEDSTEPHQRAQADGYRVIPTFRPDGLLQMNLPGWKGRLEKLEAVTDRSIGSYRDLLDALRERRQAFKAAGATATDHGAATADIAPISEHEAESLFTLALQGRLIPEQARRLEGHALFDQARLSAEEDGLVMQLHVGSTRNHNRELFEKYGPDMGADIPHRVNWTEGLRPLLDAFGNHTPGRELHAILFTLDEATYSRELAPLVGHYPSLRLGPPWWFHDSVKGIERYLDAVTETATLHNTAGFNDDTRAFPSIPARHEVWRRTVCNWLAGQVGRGILAPEEARHLARLAAHDLAVRAYRLDLK
ncbi:glucuronate isomerase [Deinococcus planocerae]|uniref:glucuronate isomerase n=1 Tax=Deinococcus planocerae TaxID=1737569 RepID=UPI000C7F21EA|nr:glucuronate isomerase [Deinococcus planocerae]